MLPVQGMCCERMRAAQGWITFKQMCCAHELWAWAACKASGRCWSSQPLQPWLRSNADNKFPHSLFPPVDFILSSCSGRRCCWACLFVSHQKESWLVTRKLANRTQSLRKRRGCGLEVGRLPCAVLDESCEACATLSEFLLSKGSIAGSRPRPCLERRIYTLE